MTSKKILQTKTTDQKTKNFEYYMNRLEKIVDSLEKGAVTLEESIKMYEEGIEISKICLEKLSEAELKIKTLGKDINGKLKIFEEDVEN